MYEIILGRNETDRKRYGKNATIFLGKHYVTMEREKSLANPMLLDVARPHVVLVCGKRGCIPGNHKIFTKQGYKEISQFDEKKDTVFSFNKNELEFEWKKAKLLKYDVAEDLIKITLEDGREIMATKEHPLLVFHKDAVLVWREAGRLKEGDILVTTTRLPEVKNDKESLRIARLLGFTLSDGNIFVQKGRWKDGRGYWYNGTKKRLRIDTDSKEVCLQAKKDVEEEFGAKARFGWRKDCNCGRVSSTNSKVIDKLITLGVPAGKKSNIIRVPKIVWESSNEFKANFINALFSCDGHVQKDGMRVEYFTNSKELIKDLQLLLAHFSIESVIREKRRSDIPGYISYRLGFSDFKSITNFRDKIGSFNKNKEARLKIKKFHLVNRRKRVKYIGNDLVCANISKINKINGINKVYDLQVPETHSFVANGIISHNSGKSYTLGVMAEGLMGLKKGIKENISCIIFDTLGIYWTMKYPNYRDEGLLEKWDMEAKQLEPVLFVPKKMFIKYQKNNISVDKEFSINPAELDPSEWCALFGIEMNSNSGALIEEIVLALKGAAQSFSVSDIIKKIQINKKFSEEVKKLLISRFESIERWGLFHEEGTSIEEIAIPGNVTVLDLSAFSEMPENMKIKSLVIGFISRKILRKRLVARKQEEIEQIQQSSRTAKEKEPLVWMLIDECLPYESEIITDKGHTPIGEVVNRSLNGESFKVLSYDEIEKEYKYNDITKVYKKAKRKIIELTTETGRKLKCTPDHKVLSRAGFIEAELASELAVPAIHCHSGNKKLIVARLLGHILGDGYLNSKGTVVGFSGKGNDGDLMSIKADLAALGFSSGSIYTRQTKSKIVDINGKIHEVNGTSQEFCASTKVHKFFAKLGAPIGTKATSTSTVPNWLLNASTEEKAEFLAALMGSDGQAPSPAKQVPCDFNAIRLSFNKIATLKENAFEYAKQLKKLFEDVGVKISKISEHKGNIRKDGTHTIKFVLTLAKNVKNTITFLERIGYRYCKIKEIKGNKWLAYLKFRQKVIKKREALRNKSIELHKKDGLGKTKIARKLKIPEWWVREWIYSGCHAWAPKLLPSFNEWVNAYTNQNTIFETIVNRKELPSTELYDISVSNVHNFVANGCVVHNCHEFLPKDRTTLATQPLIQLLREGRQPGISLVMATQQPGKIHTDALTQADIILSHRLTARLDINALNEIMQSYLPFKLQRYIDNLPRVKGAAISLDDASEKIYPFRVRPRVSWHGGEDPSAMEKIKEFAKTESREAEVKTTEEKAPEPEDEKTLLSRIEKLGY